LPQKPYAIAPPIAYGMLAASSWRAIRTATSAGSVLPAVTPSPVAARRDALPWADARFRRSRGREVLGARPPRPGPPESEGLPRRFGRRSRSSRPAAGASTHAAGRSHLRAARRGSRAGGPVAPRSAGSVRAPRGSRRKCSTTREQTAAAVASAERGRAPAALDDQIAAVGVQLSERRPLPRRPRDLTETPAGGGAARCWAGRWWSGASSPSRPAQRSGERHQEKVGGL